MMSQTALDSPRSSRHGQAGEHRSTAPLSDVCLLLRAHAEQRCLNHDVAPFVRKLQQRDHLPEEQLSAALVHLEIIWIKASRRAAETDAAYEDLNAHDVAGKRALSDQARGYHAAVCALRRSLARRVQELLVAPVEDLASEHASCSR